jgi:hypothetical protein
MQEDLLGYLLGALEPDEMRRVAQWLRDDPLAKAQLEQLERLLEPLEGSVRPIEPPPPDLVSRTLANLPPLPAGDGTHDQDPADSDTEPLTLVPLGRLVEAPRRASLTWLDWVGGAMAVAVMLGLMLPMLAEGRFEARRIACQDQLRQFGTALTQFVTRNSQERLPAVAEAGPEAFAGVYAIRLQESGLLDDPSLRWCPSLDRPAREDFSLTGIDEIVSVEQLHQASVDRLRQIQQLVGGHYAYTLGVIEQNQLAPPRFESRSSFAVMSDAPLTGVLDLEQWSDRIGHSAAGINVLYEDGSVRFIPVAALDTMPDHPLLNHLGEAEAGVNVDDASLAPSWRPPFIDVRQR